MYSRTSFGWLGILEKYGSLPPVHPQQEQSTQVSRWETADRLLAVIPSFVSHWFNILCASAALSRTCVFGSLGVRKKVWFFVWPRPVLTSGLSCPAHLKLKAFSTSHSPLRLYFWRHGTLDALASLRMLLLKIQEAWCTCVAPVPRSLTRYYKKLSAPRLR